MKYTVLIPAAGHSTRFKKNKLTFKINGDYLLNHSLYNFIEDKDCEKIVLIVNKDQFDFFKFLYRLNKKILVVSINSNSRTESVEFGLSYCKNSKYILIHDACRPYLNYELLEKIKMELNNGVDATIPVIDIVDSIVNVENSKMEYLNRNNIKRVQTPQGFKTEILLEAFKDKNNNIVFNDELSLILNKNPNIKYSYINGSIKNIKITFPEDVNDIEYDLHN